MDVTFSNIKNLSNPDGPAPDDIHIRAHLRGDGDLGYDNTYFSANLEGILYGEDATETAGTFLRLIRVSGAVERFIGAYGAKRVSN